MDLCRQVLLRLEEKEDIPGWFEIDVPGYSESEVSFHVRLLAEAGLVDAEDLTHLSGSVWMAKRLTWSGHEFLDAARNDTVWNKTKTIVREKTGTLTLELLKAGLSEVGKALLSGKIHLL